MDFHIPIYIKQIMELERQIRKVEMMAKPLSLRISDEIQSQQHDIKHMTRSIIQQEVNYSRQLNMLNPFVSSLSNQILRDFRQADIVNQHSIFESLGQSHPALMDDLVRSHQRIKDAQELTAVRHIDITTAHHIESILSTIEASARVYSKIGDNPWSLALSNAHAYQRFAEKQLNRLVKENYQIAKRRAIVTNMCGDIAQSCQCAFAIGLAMSSGEKQIIFPIPKPNIYGMVNQSLAYIYRPGSDYDAQDALEDGLTSRIVKLGNSIIFAVYQINESAQRRNKSLIFKNTNKTMIACALIPNRKAIGREDFGEIVDKLYFLLYEGSGSDKCRLCDMAGDETLEPLWLLKNLRLDLRHDIDHGDDIKNKYRKIAAAYSSLINKEIPTTSKDWSEAQHSLYFQLLNMLNEIIIAQETKDLPK